MKVRQANHEVELSHGVIQDDVRPEGGENDCQPDVKFISSMKRQEAKTP